MIRSLVPLLLTQALLTSCGGGGGSCASGVLSIVSSWNSNGVVGSSVSGKVGVALTATPTITGIPQSCKGQESFAINSGISLPAGLALNSSTGVISGTPSQAIGIGGPGCCGGLVTMSLPGYNPIQVLGIINIAP